MDKQQFTCQLAIWHKSENKRQLPWKEEPDAYKIWLSEIILQQTRTTMGTRYYEAFVARFPTVTDLALATDEEVYKMWEGLGYYTRCRNLLATARYIAKNLSGEFPCRYNDILALKGIGPYTAAAIASFAFKLPYAVVDGNVFRVLARVFAITTPIDSLAGKKQFAALANEVLDKNNPARHNQAMMDFGATVCKPIGPLCRQCPLQNGCKALQSNQVNELPVKEKVLLKRNRYFTYFILSVQQKTLVRQRVKKDIWQQLYEFYLVETESEKHWSENDVQQFLTDQFSLTDVSIKYISPQLVQQLTHQKIHAVFIKVILPKIPSVLQHENWVTTGQLKQLAFPKIVNEYLQAESFPAILF